MLRKRYIYFIIAMFVAGNALLIFIQYTSSKNINLLIRGNEKVIAELKVRNDLKELEGNITSVENKITGTLYTKDSSHLAGMSLKIAAVQSNIDNLQKISDDDTSVKYIDVLDLLVHKKLLFGTRVLDTLYGSGKEAAEKLINSDSAVILNDSIKAVSSIIENSRQKLLSSVNVSIRESGKRALTMGTILIVSVLVAGAALFWLIVTVLQKQNQLITELNTKDKKLRDAAKVKDNFLANMSHEIRTPLTAILGFTSLLKDADLDDERHKYIDAINRSGENLLGIINDILDLSKIEAGMMRIESAPFSLRDIIYAAGTLFHTKIIEKKLSFTVHIDDSIPDILEGDSMRLTQILANLISNAIKFTQQGGITLTVSNMGIQEEGIRLGITVIDTGIGIDKDKQEHIFDRFQQAEDFVTRKYGGTGLGLAIVKNLVVLQHGEIQLESDRGKGSKFSIVLPYKVSSGIPGLQDAEKKMTAEMPEVAGVRVLAAEDNELNQSLIKYLFNKWKLKFDVVSNGAEALLQLDKKEYDLVLLDIQMPVMDGYAATVQIRNKLKSRIPIIAMTAHALAGEKEKCISFGMDACISKPINETELLSLINKFTRFNYVEPSNNDGKSNGAIHQYKYIDLQYMEQLSMGNKNYEKELTGLFIETIPAELTAVKNSWNESDITKLRHLAHNLKTSVSVMGLEEDLLPTLDSLEFDDLDTESFLEKFAHLEQVCLSALSEAKMLFETF